MGQRRKQYYFKATLEKVKQQLSLIKGDATYAEMALDRGDLVNFRMTMDLLRTRASKQFVSDFPTTPITPKEQELLAKSQFEQANEDGGYTDFERCVAGFGETDDDRMERVTYNSSSNVWSWSVTHKDVDGNDWYDSFLNEGKKQLKDVITDLERNREKAPKQPTSGFYQKG